MQQIDVNQTILIVVGIDIRPEEVDRPLAYKLKSAIESSALYGNHPFRKCLVISDVLYQQDKIIQICPTIAIGGPGANIIASELIENLPIYISKENRYFIQLDKDFNEPRISIWGMDGDATAEAVDVFVANGILDTFLQKVWK